MIGASELRQAHADLLACYDDIREEFADLDDRTMARLSIARTYGPVVARVIEPPCGPVDGLLSPLGLRVNHLLSVEQGPVG